MKNYRIPDNVINDFIEKAKAKKVEIDPKEIESDKAFLLNRLRADIGRQLFGDNVYFKIDLQNYFSTRVGVPMAGRTLADAIAFNSANAATEMPFFAQEIFELAQSIDVSSPDAPQAAFGGLTYNQALDIDQASGVNGVDKALSDFNLQAIATPTGTPSWTTDLINGDHFQFATSTLAAVVGYPIVNVPMGDVFGLPVGLSFIGTAFSEPTLIGLAAGFEHVAQARIVPQLFASLPLDNVKGIPLAKGRHSPERRRHQFM